MVITEFPYKNLLLNSICLLLIKLGHFGGMSSLAISSFLFKSLGLHFPCLNVRLARFYSRSTGTLSGGYHLALEAHLTALAIPWFRFRVVLSAHNDEPFSNLFGSLHRFQLRIDVEHNYVNPKWRRLRSCGHGVCCGGS